MIYLTQPHTVIEFDDNLTPGQQYVTEAPNVLWHHGLIRGGTSPVLVEDRYWTFFHSSTPWMHSKRRYHMGAYSFKAEPPFEMDRITPMPLLSGSQMDRWHPGKPLVVFPCGALYRNGIWTVVGGYNDLGSFWIDIPHSQLVARTVDTQKKSIVELVGTMI
jgi:predicted GH43/DUF377 family glycosyl hydrolase